MKKLFANHEAEYIRRRSRAFENRLSGWRALFGSEKVLVESKIRFTEAYIQEKRINPKNLWHVAPPDDVEIESMNSPYSGPKYRVKGIWNF